VTVTLTADEVLPVTATAVDDDEPAAWNLKWKIHINMTQKLQTTWNKKKRVHINWAALYNETHNFKHSMDKNVQVHMQLLQTSLVERPSSPPLTQLQTASASQPFPALNFKYSQETKRWQQANRIHNNNNQ